MHMVYLTHVYQETFIDRFNKSSLNHVILIFILNSSRVNQMIFFYAVY